MADRLVFSTDPGWGKPGAQPQPLRLSFQRGAKGSGATRVEKLILSPADKEALLARLKKRLACGGAVKDGALEFQGDHRDAVERLLVADGYKVKRAGG